MRLVSVVVALEQSPSAIRATVDALLAQSYCGMTEIVVVGEHGDPAWESIEREIETGQVQPIQVDDGDPDHMRRIGFEAAAGDVVCTTASGTVPGSQWIATVVALSLRNEAAQRRPPERHMHVAYQ